MTSFKELVANRRSCRKFSDAPVSDEDVRCILRAALMSPTSKGKRLWHFIVVRDHDTLAEMAEVKPHGAQFLTESAVGIVVLGLPEQNDCWVEDGSLAVISMQFQAEELGLGSCWVQIRNRIGNDGLSANDALRKLLGYSEELEALCILAIGHRAVERQQQDEDKLKWNQVVLFQPKP